MLFTRTAFDDTLDEFLRESNAIEGEYSEEAFSDAKRVWDAAYKDINVNQGSIGIDDILFMHGLLMEHSWPDKFLPNKPGEFRTIDVKVGGTWEYALLFNPDLDVPPGTLINIGSRECPKPFKIPALMDNWVLDYGTKPKIEHDGWVGVPRKPWIKWGEIGSFIKKAHVRFEKIHPFVDGNGRVGRIIMNLQRVYNGLPLLVIHTGKEQEEYYEWFK